MTKSEFILSLSEALAPIPGQARERALEYFEEMIDDRIESGMSEEEAVAALGSIEEILKEIAPEAMHEQSHSEPKTSDNAKKFFVLREPIDTLIANSACANLSVRSEPLPDGLSARVDYNLSNDAECICSLKNGRLEVQYKKNNQRSFSLLNFFNVIHESIAITLNNPALVRGKIKVSSGDVELNELVFTDALEVGTASGDLHAHDVAVQHVCTLHTASGDIFGKNLTCGELVDVHAASGDIEINGIRAGKIEAHTASGDLQFSDVESDEIHCSSASGDAKLHRCKSGTIHANASSGDVSISDTKCTNFIDMHSSNGDILLRESSCAGSIQLSSTNGDITGSLFPAGEYTYNARSRIGDVKVPYTNGPCSVQIQTTTGDIIFREESWNLDSSNNGARHHRPGRSQH